MSNWTFIEISFKGSVEKDSLLEEKLEHLQAAQENYKEMIGFSNIKELKEHRAKLYSLYTKELEAATPFNLSGQEGPIQKVETFYTTNLVVIKGSLRGVYLDNNYQNKLQECVKFLQDQGVTEIKIAAFDNEGEYRIGC